MVLQQQCLHASFDEQLQIEVERLLHESGQLGLWNVTVTLSEGHATLRGRVPTYFLKQMAQAAVREAEGVMSVSDDLVVS